MAVTTKAAEKAFINVFELLSRKQSYAETFTHFLDFSLFMLSARTQEYYEQFSYLEKIYTEEVEAKAMAELYINWITIADDGGHGFRDAFGDLFMELISHGKNGQFFTPQPVCDMLARLNHGDDLKPGMPVCDPACGSGRTLLSMAKLERRLKFYGADTDITCCKMTVLNMLVNSLEGEIAWMDSISLEHYRSWHIRNVPYVDGFVPVYTVTGAGETNFFRRKEMQGATEPPRQTTGQLKLF
ncbi:N-6 DNA methylase [Chitinophaga sp. YIM B06452]|uniref:N-6 DNA methylase n=1 Tax=Chitinophaga sp. YIM B06452 TaxID=3082158 RepID=UPI0031FE675D